MKLTWRREPNEKGLAGVCQSTRGQELRYQRKTVDIVKEFTQGFSRVCVGYWWSCHQPNHNSLWDRNVFKTEEDAKADLKKYFLQQMEAGK